MRQEPHRVYWQQWAAPLEEEESPDNTTRTIVTKSAAVRISDAARAQDVTALLRKSMSHLLKNEHGAPTTDALVLVATLYNNTTAAPIQFEHPNGNDGKNKQEPLHIIKTLKSDEHPLRVRDALLQRIKQQQECAITPKLQWFFVPSSSLQMPNCIELDGYCTTSDEVEESDDDDDSDCDCDGDTTSNDVSNEYWWRKEPLYVDVVHSNDNGRNHQQQQTFKSSSSSSKRLRKEQCRWNQLKNVTTTTTLDHHPSTISGFLLKRSSHDVHVWRRVHVVLTDDHLWVVSRLHTMDDDTRIARHVRIPLNRALLMEPTSQMSPLYTIPHAFQVVDKFGNSHIFRSSSRDLQKRWCVSIQNKIRQNEQDDFLHHAELIVQDEALAHNKRIMAIAVQPLMKMNTRSTVENETKERSVLQWGMEVADYRELCRHVQSRMPAKRPIVVAVSSSDGDDGNNPTGPSSPRRLFQSPNGNGKQQQGGDEGLLDADTREMVRSAWDLAASLLARATTHFTPATTTGTTSLETLCRHVDYIISGQFRGKEEIATIVVQTKKNRSNTHNDTAPPMDLFDALLAELQTGCSNVKKVNGQQPIETPLGK